MERLVRERLLGPWQASTSQLVRVGETLRIGDKTEPGMDWSTVESLPYKSRLVFEGGKQEKGKTNHLQPPLHTNHSPAMLVF